MGTLRVWHVPQVPGKAFVVEVETLEEAIKLANILADYDEFQFKQNIKPDYCNASGIEEFLDGEWLDLVDEWLQ